MTPTTEALRALATLLGAHRSAYGAEAELQATIDHVLRRDAYTVRREVSLTPSDRIDFLVCRWPNLTAKQRIEGRGGREDAAESTPILGVETKVAGNVAAIRRQVLRYLESDRVDGLLLLSNKFTHAAAVKALGGVKPVVFCCIARAA